jgi:hypothetical protein
MNLTGIQIAGVRQLSIDASCIFTPGGPNVLIQDEMRVEAVALLTEWALHLQPGDVLDLPPIVAYCDDAYRTRVGLLQQHAGYTSVAVRLVPPLHPGGEVNVRHEYMVAPAQPFTFFRRSSGVTGADSLSITVYFDTVNEPKRFWQTEWSADTTDAVVTYETAIRPERTPLDNGGDMVVELSMMRMDVAPGRTYGFRWEW